MCDRVGVMYAGEIVERGSLRDVFDDPVHPYTQGLLGSIPDLDDPAPRLQPIEGNVPDLYDHEMEDRCYFADRCPYAMEECLNHPPEFEVTTGEPTESKTDPGEHGARCVLADHEYDPSRALPDDYFEREARSASESASGDAASDGAGVSTDD
jgi:peptide/nickel transport system ATP-binding protein